MNLFRALHSMIRSIHESRFGESMSRRTGEPATAPATDSAGGTDGEPARGRAGESATGHPSHDAGGKGGESAGGGTDESETFRSGGFGSAGVSMLRDCGKDSWVFHYVAG